jgi:acetyl esterase/lipase
VALALAAGCSRMPSIQQTSIKAKSVGELDNYLRSHKPDVDLFRFRGPFAVSQRENFELRLSAGETINSDVYFAGAVDKAPLVIFLHGYDSSKELHAYQCTHLASWGVNCIAVQLPNKGPWTVNGRTLDRIARAIQRAPELIDRRIDAGRIILAGHSFGAASVAIALGEGAPAVGGILLDPAAIGRDLTKSLQLIKRPVIIIGADNDVFETRNRDYFFRYMRTGVGEVSIRGASHEDAMFPIDVALPPESHVTEETQIAFLAALTSAAISLATTGAFDYAWTSFGGVIENGKFFDAKKK